MDGIKLQSYILPGDRKAAAKEVEAEKECIERAMGHLMSALRDHRKENYRDALWQVYQAQNRLDDFFKSRQELTAMVERFMEEKKRLNKVEELVNELKKQGVNVEIIQRERTGA